jgi:hypothetical protein
VVGSQLGQIVPKTLFQNNPSQERADGVAQGVGLEFKHSSTGKNKNKNNKALFPKLL